MKMKQTRMPVEELRFNPNNPRSRDAVEREYKRFLLRTRDQGLDAAPLVIRKDGTVLKGNVRLRTVQALKEQYPSDFEAHFGNGVPVQVVPENLSDEQIANIVHDHDVVKRSRAEFQLGVVDLFDRGYSEKKVLEHKWSEFDDHYNRLKNHEELEELREEDFEEFIAQLHKGRKGALQQIRALQQAPFVVREAWKAENGLGDGEPTPNGLNWSAIKKLNTIHQKEEEGTQAKPGPKFLEAWAAIMNEEAKTTSAGALEPRAKTQPRPKIVELKDKCGHPTALGFFDKLLDANQELPAEEVRKIDLALEIVSYLHREGTYKEIEAATLAELKNQA